MTFALIFFDSKTMLDSVAVARADGAIDAKPRGVLGAVDVIDQRAAVGTSRRVNAHGCQALAASGQSDALA